MATKDQNARSTTRLAGLRKPTRCGTDTQWDRACRDAEQRTKIHPSASGEADTGCVYIMKSASGLIKVGYTGGDDPAHRLAAMQCLVGPEHRPVDLVGALRMQRRLALKTERLAHERLARLRVFDSPCSDEWFHTNGQRAGCVVRHAVSDASRIKVWARAQAIWENRKLKTWADTAPGLKALGLTPREAWRKFGART